MSKKNFMSESVRKIDMFGQPVSVNFKGETMYGTPFGGVITFLSIIITMIYTFERGVSMVLGSDPTTHYNTQTMIDVAEKLGEMSAKDLNFGLVFYS
jgi:hypothetical protein